MVKLFSKNFLLNVLICSVYFSAIEIPMFAMERLKVAGVQPINVDFFRRLLCEQFPEIALVTVFFGVFGGAIVTIVVRKKIKRNQAPENPS